MQPMSPRERMLTALDRGQPDHVPCCFMIYSALREQCRDQFDFVERQLELGLDAVVGLPVRETRRARDVSEQGDLHGLPVRFAPSVDVKDWREDVPGERYPLLHRTYSTPAGSLHTTVIKTDDWVQGDRVPLFDDFVIPRARKRLITQPADLAPLEYLLQPPTAEDIAVFRDNARQAKAFAARLDLPVVGEWGVLADALCWLCGIEELIFMAMEQPEFLERLLGKIAAWNRTRMEIILEAGIDLFIRRAWYETADFWSPDLYGRFIFPHLERDVRTAHQAGSRLAVITTNACTPLEKYYIEADIDVLIGLDPVQDVRADFERTKRELGGQVCLWGGVNGFVTVERGSPGEVRQAVHDAVRVLAPGGGFILSPVDNITVDTPRTRTNVTAFIEAWRECRDLPFC